jgi:hypothetical protein
MKLKSLVILAFIALVSITIYKFTIRDAPNEPKPQQSTLEVQSPPELNAPKDPFKEALEKQSQHKDGQQILIQPTQVVPNKDPFKEFLEKQAKDLGQSKVSPFAVPSEK